MEDAIQVAIRNVTKKLNVNVRKQSKKKKKKRRKNDDLSNTFLLIY